MLFWETNDQSINLKLTGISSICLDAKFNHLHITALLELIAHYFKDVKCRGCKHRQPWLFCWWIQRASRLPHSKPQSFKMQQIWSQCVHAFRNPNRLLKDCGTVPPSVQICTQKQALVMRGRCYATTTEKMVFEQKLTVLKWNWI